MNKFAELMNARAAISAKMRGTTDIATLRVLDGEMVDLTNQAYKDFPEEMANHRRELAKKVVASA